MKKNALQNVLNGVGAALVASACVAAFAVEETTNVKVDVVFNGDDVVGYVDSNGKFHGVAGFYADREKLRKSGSANPAETKGAVSTKKSGEFYKAFVASNKKSLAATRGKMAQAGVIRVGVYRWIDPNAEEEFELAAMPVPEPARHTRGSEGFAKGGGASIATDAVGETERKLKKKRGEIGEKIAEFTIKYGEPPILR